MQIIEIAPTATVNPFADDIAKLAEMTEANPQAAGEFIVPTAEVGKTKFKIGKAANAIDLTAALALEEPAKEKGQTRLVYRLKPRHKTGPRAARTVEAIEATETVEATAE